MRGSAPTQIASILSSTWRGASSGRRAVFSMSRRRAAPKNSACGAIVPVNSMPSPTSASHSAMRSARKLP